MTASRYEVGPGGIARPINLPAIIPENTQEEERDPCPSTPEDSVEEEWGTDGLAQGEKDARFARNFAIGLWVLIVLAVTVLGQFLVPAGLAFAIGLACVVPTFPYTLTDVPTGVGLVLLNLLRRPPRRMHEHEAPPTYNLRALPPGLHFKKPWESDPTANLFSLELQAKTELSESYPAKDGPLMHAEYSYQWRADPGRLNTFIFMDPSVINEGIHDVLSGFLSRRIAEMTALTARNSMKELQEEVRNLYEDKCHELERLYGIIIEYFALRDVEFEENFQKARSTRRSMDELWVSARKLSRQSKKSGDHIPSRDAMDMVLMINGQPVKKDIFAVEGSGMEGAAAFLAGIAKSIGGQSNQGGGGKSTRGGKS